MMLFTTMEKLPKHLLMSINVRTLISPSVIGAILSCILSFSPVSEADDGGSFYRLGPGDEIAISVFGEEDLSMEFRLNDTGILNYPLLGELQLGGLSVIELEQLIAGGLKGPYLIDPDVTVSIKEYRAFYLSGEVRKPGGYPFQPGLTVEKAIALAGGFTERASRSKIDVNRAEGSSDSAVRIKLTDAVNPGDVITVHQSFF